MIDANQNVVYQWHQRLWKQTNYKSFNGRIDVIQVGTRNFQNYSLLDELGKLDKPILLKRGTWGTLDEILGGMKNT